MLLRGGESGHASFVSYGKGRDVGALQVLTFETKIAAGTAIASTSRDAARFLASIDFPRMLSAVHTGVGYYVSEVLIVMVRRLFGVRLPPARALQLAHPLHLRVPYPTSACDRL